MVASTRRKDIEVVLAVVDVGVATGTVVAVSIGSLK